MLRLEVIALCLLFGALTHSQVPRCTSECHQTEPLFPQCSHIFFVTQRGTFYLYNALQLSTEFYLSFVFSPGKHQCPIDVYFTIDTSETIALQEPPPGSLVESIKVALVYFIT